MLPPLPLWLAVFSACFFTTTPASALEFAAGAIGLTDLIAGALGTTAAVGGLASAIGGAIVGIGVAAALTVGAKLFAPKTSQGAEAAQTPTGVQSQLTVGANVPRNAIVGPQATAGQLTYWNLYGDQNRFLQLVFTLGVGPHDDLTGIIVNGTRCTLGGYEGGGGAYTQYRPVTEFDRDGNHSMWVRFFNGFYDQVADQELVDFANPAGRWTTDNRGRGICYVSITLDYIFPDMWPQGIPQFLFEVQGLRLYDRRLDSTNGGSGTHRWDDQHTWEYSDNPALALYLFERGLYVGSRKQLGRGLAPVDLISDLFVTAANICDESVAIKEGGTEPRYRIGMNIGVDRDWSSVEHDFCIAMSGWIMESAGAYGPIAGADQTSVVSITDDDLITGRECVYSQKRSRSELVNTIFGTYTDPTQNWQMIPYPARASSADVAVDGAEFAAQRDYPMLFSLPQVQRAGEIERRLGRHQATAEVCLGFRFSNIEQGDWIDWTSARRDFTKTFQVTRIRVDDDDSISLSLREISLDVFDFDETIDELDPLNPGDLAGINDLITSVPDFSIEALQIPGAGGLTIPALHAFWSPILDQTVDEVYVEYRIVGTGDVKVSPTFTPANGEGIISDGIQAATNYEARANILTTPIRETFWTAWVPVTAPVNHVVPQALSLSSGGIDYAALSAAVTEILQAGQQDLRRIVQFIASKSVEQDARALLDEAKIRDDLGTVIADLTSDYATSDRMANARAYSALVAQSTASQALSAFTVDLNTNFVSSGGTATSAANILLTAASNAENAIADYDVSISTSYGSSISASVENQATAVSDLSGFAAARWAVKLDVNGYQTGFELINGGASTGVAAFNVDNFYIAHPSLTGGDATPVFAVSTIDGIAHVGIRGDLLVDGSIQSPSLTTGVINASTLFVDDVIVRGKIAADTSTKMVATGGVSDSFSWNTAESSAGSISITTVGGTVFVNGNVAIRQLGLALGVPDASAGDVYLRLYIDSVLARTVYMPARGYAQSNTTTVNLNIDFVGSWNMDYVHTPSAGTHTYEIVVASVNNNGWGPTTFDCSLAVFEARR